MTHTEYYEQVGHGSDCKLEATVNQAKKIVLFKIQDGKIRLFAFKGVADF
ncbi:hypothetical protein [Pseudomonas helleri]|nr:hypothetical protein [Pseudomonas helleri]